MKVFEPKYSNSFALCIGIDNYKNVSPLHYAKSDAQTINNLIIENFNFPKENVTLLLDEKATKGNILESFLSFAESTKIGENDRILIYYAGHGHTITGNRGEVGYLVPVNGNSKQLNTLIRWDELTRNSELIKAKHILFIMDACYGGLAFTRSITKGSMRFLKDMLKRYSRQVITAGKADETVADSGGPIPEHSIFTGHLIQALVGNAETTDKTMTANGVMSYVYEKVSRDHHSNQTPHFGYIEGDGDFIFKAPILNSIKDEDDISKDVLFEIPTIIETPTIYDKEAIIDKTKEYISDLKYRIKLDDLLTSELRILIENYNIENYPLASPETSSENILKRFSDYQNSIDNLISIIIPITHWGSSEYTYLIEKALTRLSDHIGETIGKTIWVNSRWFPLLLLFYYGGLSSIASQNYGMLFSLFNSKIQKYRTNNDYEEVILVVIHSLFQLISSFKELPDYERYYAPHSEYFFKLIQPALEDILFLGRSYEYLFDKFEIFLALIHADLLNQKQNRILGPFGRFAWKYHELPERSLLVQLREDAIIEKNDWAPLKAGFFGSDLDRFIEISSKYEEQIKNLNWY